MVAKISEKEDESEERNSQKNRGIKKWQNESNKSEECYVEVKNLKEKSQSFQIKQ